MGKARRVREWRRRDVEHLEQARVVALARAEWFAETLRSEGHSRVEVVLHTYPGGWCYRVLAGGVLHGWVAEDDWSPARAVPGEVRRLER